MTKNPLLNALSATGYIALVVSLIFYGPKFEHEVNGIIVPIVILSLFVLSAAMMSTIFFYQPIRMYLNGEKEPAFDLFLKTLVIFASVTVLIFSGIFFFIGVKIM